MDQIGLVDRARRGDRQAFAELIRASGGRLDATARLILRDPQLAQDAVQDTLIRAWRSLPGLRDPETFDHWLHSLVAHACIDLLRKRRRRVIEVELGPVHEPPTLDDAARVADRDQLDRALARLEPEARAVVVLHFYLDLPLPRVAAMLGIPVGTAKSRLHRSLGALRSTMAIDEVASASATLERRSRHDHGSKPPPRPRHAAALRRACGGPHPRLPRGRHRARLVPPQRPAWTFPGRWLPVTDITGERAVMPAPPWRLIALALLAIALVVGALLAAGSQQRGPLPAAISGRWLSGPRDATAFPPEAGMSILIRPDRITLSTAASDRNVLFESIATATADDAFRLTNASGCAADAAGRYRWSLSPSGRVLTISADTPDPCPERAAAVVGTWEQVGCIDPSNNCLGAMDPGRHVSQFFSPRRSAPGPRGSRCTARSDSRCRKAGRWPRIGRTP